MFHSMNSYRRHAPSRDLLLCYGRRSQHHNYAYVDVVYFIEYCFGFVLYHMPVAGGPDSLPPFLFVEFAYGLYMLLELILVIFSPSTVCAELHLRAEQSARKGYYHDRMSRYFQEAVEY